MDEEAKEFHKAADNLINSIISNLTSAGQLTKARHAMLERVLREYYHASIDCMSQELDREQIKDALVGVVGMMLHDHINFFVSCHAGCRAVYMAEIVYEIIEFIGKSEKPDATEENHASTTH